MTYGRGGYFFPQTLSRIHVLPPFSLATPSPGRHSLQLRANHTSASHHTFLHQHPNGVHPSAQRVHAACVGTGCEQASDTLMIR